MAKAEAIEALLYGSMTWTPRQADYGQLRTTYHRILLRILGEAGAVRADHRVCSYAGALQRLREYRDNSSQETTSVRGSAHPHGQ